MLLQRPSSPTFVVQPCDPLSHALQLDQLPRAAWQAMGGEQQAAFIHTAWEERSITLTIINE